MRILVVDDEPLARVRLVRLLDELPSPYEVVQAEDAEMAWRQIEVFRPDLLLLDIHMPGMDGLELAQRIQQLPLPPALIFCTAHQEHALEAFRCAEGYLLKPVRRDELAAALQRVARPHRALGHDAHLYVQQGGRSVQIPLAQVVGFQADHKYVRLMGPSQELLLEDSLNQLEKRFPERFIRIHRNALVARQALQGLIRSPDGSHRLLLAGCDWQPSVSRRHLAALRQLLQDR